MKDPIVEEVRLIRIKKRMKTSDDQQEEQDAASNHTQEIASDNDKAADSHSYPD